jgi:hypothetical protein
VRCTRSRLRPFEKSSRFDSGAPNLTAWNKKLCRLDYEQNLIEFYKLPVGGQDLGDAPVLVRAPTSWPRRRRLATTRSVSAWDTPLARTDVEVCTTSTPCCTACSTTYGARPELQCVWMIRGRLLHPRCHRAHALPGVLAQVAHAHVEYGAADQIDGLEAGAVEARRQLAHHGRGHACGPQALVGVAQRHIDETNGRAASHSQTLPLDARMPHSLTMAARRIACRSRSAFDARRNHGIRNFHSARPLVPNSDRLRRTPALHSA